VDLPSVAPLVSGRTVLFGNLPTKKFYSDAEMPLEKVTRMAEDLANRMRATGHPFILGNECDVLHVDAAHATIARKVNAMCHL